MIRVPNIRVIDHEGKQLGILSTRDAITLATGGGFDLIEISPTANPPVCRIGDFGKYKYELAKKQKDAKKKQHIVHLKELKMHPKTEEHDYGYRLKHAKEFLLDGDKVKFTVTFKGREMAYLEFGRKLLDQAAADLADIADCELKARMEGKNMFSVFTVKKDVYRKAKAERDRLKKIEDEKRKAAGLPAMPEEPEEAEEGSESADNAEEAVREEA